MVAQEPQLARLHVDLGLVGQRRRFVRVGQTRAREAVPLAQVREQCAQARIGGLEVGEQRRQLGVIGVGQRADRVEAGQDQALLGLG